MADVRLSIAGREYIVTCKDGEEQRLQALGALVDEKAREAGGPSGGLNESRLLLFSAFKRSYLSVRSTSDAVEDCLAGICSSRDKARSILPMARISR
jgi:Cell division protein ZapA